MIDIELFFTEKDAVSPGGRAAIGIKHNSIIQTYCIGNGDNFRDAKACALLNLRQVIRQLETMKIPELFRHDKGIAWVDKESV